MMTENFNKVESLGFSAVDLTEVNSTNTYAQKRLVSGDDEKPFLISAASQSAGHGKVGRSFFSPKNQGAYFTLGIPSVQWQKWHLSSGQLTVTAAVAAEQVLTRIFDQDISIKWVNDLYLQDRKIAGILAESAVNDQNQVKGVVIGWGINLSNPEQWPDQIKQRAGALTNEAISSDLRLKVVDEVVYRLVQLLSQPWPEILAEYRQKQYLAGHDLLVTNGKQSVRGHFDHIDDLGRLCLLTDSGLKVFETGTVRIVE